MSTTASSASARLPLGVLLTVLAFLAVAVMSAFAKAASDTGLSAGVLVFFQNAISLALLLPWVLRGGVAGLKTRRPALHFLRAVGGLLSQYLLFVALQYIPLVDAVLLANAAPLFIPLISWLWLKQAIPAKLWASLVIGFVGVVLILQPGGGVFSWATPLALAAGACSALALVAVGLLDTTEPPARTLAYYFLISSVLTAPLLVADWTTPGPRGWLWLVGVGVTMALAQFLLILAYDQASAAALSPFNYSVVVFSGLLGWLVWGEVPNALSLVGVVLVCAGGVLATRQRGGAAAPPPAAAPRSATRREQAMSTSAVECVVRAEAIVGESPVWSPREKALFWVDITGQKIHRFHPASGANDTFELPEPVTAVALREKGDLVVTLRKDFALYDPATGALRRLSDPEADRPDNRFNDAKCDRRGRFWAGTMAAVKWDEPAGSLYRLDPDARVSRMQGDCVCANGLGWSPDDRTFYFTESFRYAVFAYDFDADTGAISNRRLFASVDQGSGAFPDGLTVDAEGCVWSVHNAVGRVVRYSPAGKIDRVVEVPVPRPCSCIFGGEKLDVLYITTARETLTAEQIARAPLSGSVFALRPGVCGLPEAYFAG